MAAARLHIRPFRPDDAAAVVELWRECGLVRPQNDPHKDIARKLRVNPEWFLVGEAGGRIVASVMAGYEGHRGWLNYVAVAPDRRRSGCGRRIVAAAERLLRAAGCPKINLQVRADNRDVIAFYGRLGWRPDEVLSMGKRLVHDRPKGGRARARKPRGA